MVRFVKDKTAKSKTTGGAAGGSGNKSKDEAKEESNDSNKQSGNNDAPTWRTSAARDFLYNALLDETIPKNPAQMKPKEVYETICKNRPEFKHFQNYKDLDFANKLRSARERVNKKTSRADID